MFIEVSESMLDEIVNEQILDSISTCYTEINELLDMENLEDYQRQDLADSILYFKALKKVYKYYAADHSALEGFEL